MQHNIWASMILQPKKLMDQVEILHIATLRMANSNSTVMGLTLGNVEEEVEFLMINVCAKWSEMWQ